LLLLELPLERGAAARDNEALIIERGHTEIVRLLLELPPERGAAAREGNSRCKRLWTYGNCPFAPGIAARKRTSCMQQ